MNKRTLLVVDQESALIETIKMAIERIGLQFEVVSARTGEEAFQKLWEHNADIVLASTRIPSRRAFDELIQSIRGAQLGTVIVTMTGGQVVPESLGGKTAQEQFGTDLVITKPFVVGEFAEMMHRAMELMPQTA